MAADDGSQSPVLGESVSMCEADRRRARLRYDRSNENSITIQSSADEEEVFTDSEDNQDFYQDMLVSRKFYE